MNPRYFTTRAAAALVLAIVVVLQLAAVSASSAPIDPIVAGGGGNGGGGMQHHLHFFMHDGYPTAVLIVNGSSAAGNNRRRFGDTTVIDDVLTEGPGRASRPVGRAQGTYVLASLEEARPALLLNMNLVLAGGGTVAVMGRNELTAPVRELSVVGGTGRFRMATGYVLWKTASWSADNAAVLELDVFLRAAA